MDSLPAAPEAFALPTECPSPPYTVSYRDVFSCGDKDQRKESCRNPVKCFFYERFSHRARSCKDRPLYSLKESGSRNQTQCRTGALSHWGDREPKQKQWQLEHSSGIIINTWPLRLTSLHYYLFRHGGDSSTRSERPMSKLMED